MPSVGPGTGTRLWSPADGPIRVSCWIDAADTATIASTGSGVTSIRDKSGNGNDLTYVAGTINTGTRRINNRNAIDVTTTGSYMSCPLTGAPSNRFIAAAVEVDDPNPEKTLWGSVNTQGYEY